MKQIYLGTREAVMTAVEAGHTVHWANDGYRVITHPLGYMIHFPANGYMCGCCFTPYDFGQGFYYYSDAE